MVILKCITEGLNFYRNEFQTNFIHRRSDPTKKNFSCSSYGPEIFLNLELLKNEQLLFSEVISQPLAKVI